MSFDPNQLLNHSPLAILVCDQSGRIIYNNPLFLKQTSLTQEQVLGQLYTALPLEAIDTKSQKVQLFSSDQVETIIFSHWQQAAKPTDSSTKTTIHYFIRERENSEQPVINNKIKSLKLPKRASWVEFLDYEVSRSRRYDNPLAILKLHLIVFDKKDENDEQKQSLEQTQFQQIIKDTLMAELRWADMIGQTDLGSFLMILPETPSDAVAVLQNKLKKSISRELSIVDKSLKFQLVFAEASWRKHDDSQRLLERARGLLVEKLEKLLE